MEKIERHCLLVCKKIINKYVLKEIFRDLYKSEVGLLIYTLYGRYGIEPDEAITFIDTYSRKKIIEVIDGIRVKLTELGRIEMADILKDIQMGIIEGDNFYLRKLLFSSMNIYEPYIPFTFSNNSNKDIEPF